MALIQCPECGKSISDKSDVCVHCGLPSSYFRIESHYSQSNLVDNKNENNDNPVDYSELRNVFIAFDKEYPELFSGAKYISMREIDRIKRVYGDYYVFLQNQLILQYVNTNSGSLKIEISQLNRFIDKLTNIDRDREIYNERYIETKLKDYKDYFDNILKEIDPNIYLDEEQRRAVLTNENHCLLVAGAGAGKTTTMAAKVKYLVDKEEINPEDIIVISYTNKAIEELKERINKKLKIPAKICTFHSFAYEIVKRTAPAPPEINFSAYNIVFEMLEKRIFDNKKLLKNLVLFLGYYFDLPEDAFRFNSLNEYHLYKAASDYETIKSGLGEYIRTVENRRTKYQRTITGEYLRSMQEVQIANFLYLHGIEYEYEKPYPFEIHGAKKIYTPDFFIRQGENECYIEHFGVTQSMNCIRQDQNTQKSSLKMQRALANKY